MGLILAQSALVGLAIGLFDANMWLDSEDAMLNGFTYAMAAFFVQGIAYYFFKMFFEQNMQERVRVQNMERERQGRYRNMQNTFDHRRAEMELRMQEALVQQQENMLTTNPPKHNATIKAPVNLGVKDDEITLKKDGTPDKRYMKE